MSRCEQILEQFSNSDIQTSVQSIPSSDRRDTRIRLPKIDLPVFSGAYEDWYSYQDTFEKLIHVNPSLTDIERFHYLRSWLKDKAAEVVKSIETTTDNYHEAWNAVKERFDNKRWIVRKHIKAIFDAPAVMKENHVALRDLLDTILKDVRALRALKRPTSEWSDLLIYIIVSKLDRATTKAWETSLVDSNILELKTLINLCMNCLKSTSHQAKACNSGSCRKCNNKHNTLLHLSSVNNSNQSQTSKPDSGQSEHHLSSSVLLSTAVIYIYDSVKQAYPCRVLLDNGSQMNFITQELVNKLKIEERPLEITASCVMEEMVHAKHVVSVCIKSHFNNFSKRIECVVIPRITQPLPQQIVPSQSVIIPKNIKLIDPNFRMPADIDMLVGDELFFRILCAGQIVQAKNKPILQKTQFGWIVSGPTMSTNADSVMSVNHHITLLDDLNYKVSRFWEVEHNIAKPQWSEDERACERTFLETVKRTEEGRFTVTLPVKPDQLSKLGESRKIAMQRFESLERRFASQPSLHEKYKNFIKEYITLGHMREVTNEQTSSTGISPVYLPHHAVRNEASTTTKLRVVFDGSCKTTTGISLNDTLMVGPTVQDDLFSILTRNRIFKIAMTADIRKMYRQVLLDPTQTALQRIVWRDTKEDPIKIFELMTVTYGTAAAPFFAIRSLRKLAEDHINQYPVASQITLRDFYVDDLVTGTDSLEEASYLKNELIQLLQEGKFELQK
ncbi:hypothetical protein ALC62_00745 [Cyphomyrmex costatus]|uniref:Uncharacterized protein n=1 Tax=Cyphomyrmex costatus TaxID=456900 RepID=A0A151IQ50_9HYME|nr:hypothetical protein ALC62_00745 [Cyphomyrmex costatus]